MIGVRPILAASAALALGTVAAGAQAGAGQAQPRPRVALTANRPVVVEGTGFRGRERVRVEVRRVGGRAARRVSTTAGGRFSVTFARVRVSRCDALSVVATGASGRHAELHRRAALACGLP